MTVNVYVKSNYDFISIILLLYYYFKMINFKHKYDKYKNKYEKRKGGSNSENGEEIEEDNEPLAKSYEDILTPLGCWGEADNIRFCFLIEVPEYTAYNCEKKTKLPFFISTGTSHNNPKGRLIPFNGINYHSN